MKDSMADVVAEIEKHLTALASEIAAGATAERVADLLYADNACVVGRDMPAAVRGRGACIELLREVLGYWGVRPELRYTIANPAVVNSQQATIMVRIDIRGDRPEVASLTYRVMYAFERREAGWRVVLEMYDSGGL